MKEQRLYVPVYAATMLLSAFLLFAVQPMFGKMILPLLGGTPGIWNMAMVFFQAALLGGYLYAHLLSKLRSLRSQAVIHFAILAACAFVLPIAIPHGWEPPATDNPAFWQLTLMAVAVGGPFFALSASAPLLQHWFSRTGHAEAHNPYFLYAASNIGSLGALLLYPLLVEPLLTLHGQSVTWAAGYGVLAALIVLCAALTGKGTQAAQAAPTPADDATLTPARVALWLLLAFIPSSLMLGVTTFITTDLASAPLLWIIPLALYVGTFIIAFARQWPVKLNTVLRWQGIFFVAVIGVFIGFSLDSSFPIILLHLGLFALTALFCHMQLAALRPPARHLTAFYLIMSAGGVMGGIFNALIAPRLFPVPVEYALVLALSGFLRNQTDPAQSFEKLHAKINFETVSLAAVIAAITGGACFLILMLPFGHIRIAAVTVLCLILLALSRRRWVFAGLIAVILTLYPGYDWRAYDSALAWKRNFFGVMRVMDSRIGLRLFSHGTTLHGAQPLDQAHRLLPMTYYNPKASVGDVFRLMDARKGPQAIAGLGLGVGSIACYPHPGRHFDFYEIDPDVAAIAENPHLFTYLSDCGSLYKIVIGDARLKIAKAPDHSYDLIFVDTFSSDNIPVHLITREAFALYLQKLKPGGLIAINISNRHLTLEPVIAAAGRDLKLRTLFHSRPGELVEGTKMPYAASIFAALAPQQKTLDSLAADGWHPWPAPARKAWSDDFSNIIGAIRLHDPVADKR